MLLLSVLVFCQVHLMSPVFGQVTRPRSPCPNVFQYELVTRMDNYKGAGLKGVIMVTETLPVNLRVELEIPLPLSSLYSGQLEVVERNRLPYRGPNGEKVEELKYNMYFPEGLPLPHVILIEANNKVLCSSSPMPSRVKTTVTLTNTYRSVARNPITIGGLGFKKEQNLGGFNNPEIPRPFRPGDQGRGRNPGNGATLTVPSNYNVYFFPGDEPPIELNTEKVPNKPPGEIVFEEVGPINRPYFSPYNEIRRVPEVRPDLTLNENLLSFDSTCGKPKENNPLIIGGSKSQRGEWSWMVPLFKQTGAGVQFFCGSSLISDQLLIGAAHCVSLEGLPYLHQEDILAYVGRYNLRNWEEDGTQPRRISQIYLHPDYNNKTLYSDLVIFRLDRKVTYSQFVSPICLWSEDADLNIVVGERGMVSGWGMDGRGNVITDTPQMLEMPIVSQEDCIFSKPAFRRYASNRTFCAGSRDGTGPCNGDSGSGLVLLRKSRDGKIRYHLRGIVSLSLPRAGSRNMCDLFEYIVFTDVAKFRNWISGIFFSIN